MTSLASLAPRSPLVRVILVLAPLCFVALLALVWLGVFAPPPQDGSNLRASLSICALADSDTDQFNMLHCQRGSSDTVNPPYGQILVDYTGYYNGTTPRLLVQVMGTMGNCFDPKPIILHQGWATLPHPLRDGKFWSSRTTLDDMLAQAGITPSGDDDLCITPYFVGGHVPSSDAIGLSLVS